MSCPGDTMTSWQAYMNRSSESYSLYTGDRINVAASKSSKRERIADSNAATDEFN